MSEPRIYPAVHPDDYVRLDPATLRERFLLDHLFKAGCCSWAALGDDRLLLAGVCPTAQPIELSSPAGFGSEPLCERREVGIVNLGQPGLVTVDGEVFHLATYDGLYIGRGAEVVTAAGDGARFYCSIAPAHATYPTRHIAIDQALPKTLGARETSNERTIYLYVAPGVVESCQLMMGMTRLAPGSVWNTMPCHLHQRRMEVYLYCDLPDEQMIVHLMGRPEATRHVIARNQQAVIAPSWSIHSAAGTSAYSFVWCMLGENQDFADMQAVPTTDLR